MTSVGRSDERETIPPSVVVNIDDVGMCHGANQAYLELRRLGAVDSGSVMVPCPWFLEIAEAGVLEPGLNLGIHLTLTSEKRHYRWRPLTKATAASGLTDRYGFMWQSVAELRRYAHPDAVEAEMRAQVETFLAAGLTPSHIDGHMGGVFSPEFVDRYVALCLEFDLPALFPATIAAYGPKHNLGEVDQDSYTNGADRLIAAGGILACRALETPWHRREPAPDRYRNLYEQIGPGLNFLCLHANAVGEIEAIEPDTAQIRIEEFELLKDPTFRSWADSLPVRRGSLRELMAADRPGSQ
ncbi:ChbG/HpnK family deacetylase [Rhizobium leguminosarum]|uniref:polysaccharide deacetylase family protein n=1 Tax=Rhizobium TaxID=379 RepID=UPI00037BA4FD|nr:MULTISPECIES: polysaccharide deacetylase family protein [Rhizobium]NEH49751.1 ChbG/HpnK family deacetylase [Rhizobium leguminosarum]NEH57719.1 ChbG/HpnK family deacetylase [Rhizobium leguminosarum]NEJ15586.1 ChbG/HpnK family deacetylase [Rhizobium ruizarguesonis]NEK29661.1 ChbG/HpnK family deacetylase [Rhizobium ruizarguesonis]NKK29718.1 ChbG/HpnK family deacetylase [Rhizobium leguminosarum bv. viciae]